MIGVKIDKKSLDSLFKELKKMKKIIKNPNLQLVRANAFRKYAIDMVESNSLDLKPISETTKKIDKMDHPPEWKTGDLLKSMGVRPSGRNSAKVGYFSDDGTKIKGKEITVTQAAILQTTGFKIPLFGEKGKRVRAWLGWKGAFSASFNGTRPMGVSGEQRWIVVPARPFFYKAFDHYEAKNIDIKVVDEFLNKLIKKESISDV